MGTELMTGFISSASNPMSGTTIASVRDLGYVVDLSQADPYTLSSPTNLRSLTESGVRMVNDIARGSTVLFLPGGGYRIIDISVSGALLQTEGELPVGNVFELTLQLEDTRRRREGAGRGRRGSRAASGLGCDARRRGALHALRWGWTGPDRELRLADWF